jgi:Lrp/AsnC family transcriptional regulator, leucine-responsive regulatory protein
MTNLKLDYKDHEILKLLQENSRYTIRETSLKTKIKPSTIHQRIQKLIKNKIIERFTLKLNKKALGESFTAFVFFSTDKTFEEKDFKYPQIKKAYNITGEYDYLIELRFEEFSEFNEFLINFKSLKKISKLISLIVTKTIKQE